MSTSPDLPRAGSAVRGETADAASAAQFDVDLRGGNRAIGELAEAARAAAQTAGYADGWAQGQRAARLAAQAALAQSQAVAEAAQQAQLAALDQAVGAVARAATALEARVTPMAEDLEDMIMGFAVDLAEALLARELSDVGVRAAEAARRAMALAPASFPVTLRLHPEDLRTLGGDRPAEYQFEGRQVRLIADPTLEPGDAIAECGATTIDASLAEARNRVRALLDPNVGQVGR
ncbi:hypothetical protein GCM10009682_49800 [Luedemannella flava]|uniref:Flagellar assembly protein FliH/Type III secretion system HrpE domain-containing protein n=1 Tax=Luedemannella flava TaxID=349316 RepID=A0ABP4YPY3_9ACTN